MIPDFPHSMKIRLTPLKTFLLRPDVAKSLLCWLSQLNTTKKNLMGPILFLYYEERLVSSNLNSKQLRFHGAHPNIHMYSRVPNITGVPKK